MDRTWTRRAVLAGAAGTGALATGLSFRSLTNGGPTLEHRITYAAGDVDLLLEWTTTANGVVVRSGETPADGDGFPVVTLRDVQPGDTGSLSLRVSLADGAAGPARVFASAEGVTYAENGVGEPEAKTGDSGPVGELQTAISASLVESRTGRTVAAGTLADVLDALSATVRLDPAGEPCFDGSDWVRLELDWALDSTETNALQSDEVSFDLAFRSESCVLDTQ